MRLKIALCAAVVALGIATLALGHEVIGGPGQGNQTFAERVAQMEPGSTRDELVEQLVMTNPGISREEVLASAEQAAQDSGLSVDVVLRQAFLEAQDSIKAASAP